MDKDNFKKFTLVARVLEEDDEKMVLEVSKDDTREFKLSEDVKKNQFVTMGFIRVNEGNVELWKPWEHKFERSK